MIVGVIVVRGSTDVVAPLLSDTEVELPAGSSFDVGNGP